MDELELSKYMNWMEGEYGPQWKEVLKDQLRTNQLGDHSPNYSFAEKTLPSNMGLLNSREEIDQVLGSKLVDNPEYPHIKPGLSPTEMMRTDGAPVGPPLLSEAPFNNQYTSLGLPSTVHAPQMQALESSSSFIPAASSSLALEAGPSGYASLDAMAGTTLPYAGEGTAEALAAETAASGSSAWGGPATFAGNLALNMIPTRDRDKVDTPLGDEGSMSGILKGGGKGALLGATIGSVVPVVGTGIGAAVGGTLGAIGGAQGYFDSTSAPIIQIARIKQGRGMPQGLLGGGSMYG